MFYCGDDIDIGNLKAARYIEPMVGLWRSLVASDDVSGEFAFSLVRR